MFRSYNLFRSLKPPIKECFIRSFKRQPLEGNQIDSIRLLKVSDLWKPALFSAAFTGTVFAGCSIWQYESYVKSHTFIAVKNIKESLNRFNSQAKRGQYRNEVSILIQLHHDGYITKTNQRQRNGGCPCQRHKSSCMELVSLTFAYSPPGECHRYKCLWIGISHVLRPKVSVHKSKPPLFHLIFRTWTTNGSVDVQSQDTTPLGIEYVRFIFIRSTDGYRFR